MKRYTEKLIYKPTNKYEYAPESGSFCRVRSVQNNTVMRSGDWHSCRETFSSRFTSKVENILFATEYGKKVANFIDEVEKRLKIEEKTSIQGIKDQSFCLVQVSPWWTQSSLRRQLFTILLRCGRNFDGNKSVANFKYALNSNGYSKQTERAIEKFFQGNTEFKGMIGGFGGWVSKFSEITDSNNHWHNTYEITRANARLERNLNKLYNPTENEKIF